MKRVQKRVIFSWFNHGKNYENKDFQSISLPYGHESGDNRGRYSMYLFLPNEKIGLEDFHKTLTDKNWTKWMDSYRQVQGTITLPRFELEYEVKLNEALKALGMKKAFDESQANFSNMIETHRVYIDSVKHKTYVKANEEGTEAAAATSVKMTPTSAPAESFNMNVNRPFFFAIRDDETGSILFMGSIFEPEE